MGLGKTIQGVASMSIYHDEWPLLVLTPSSARYHWESEFQQWLGADSTVNQSTGNQEATLAVPDDDQVDDDNEVIPPENYKNPMDLLHKYEIHVLTTSKEDVFPHRETRVVICSYGLAPALVESGKIRPGTFKCAIVDER
jgi:SWI/SNF-related matrix-associated actin-dependent regulator 1 of chromatin subfamily A